MCIRDRFYIPRLIRSSIFYDQLLMILEHFSCHDEKINDMVRKRCVREFYKMPMRLEEYGDPQMGEVINPFESDWSGRAFQMCIRDRHQQYHQTDKYIRQIGEHRRYYSIKTISFDIYLI